MPWQVPKGGAWVAPMLGWGLVNLMVVGLAFGGSGPPYEQLVLGAGRTNGVQWKVSVHRERRRAVPCFDLQAGSVASHGSGGSTVEVCLPLPGPPKVTTYLASRKDRVVTLLAGGFEPAIVRVIIVDRSGRRLSPTVKRLSRTASRRLELPRFRYIRRAVSGVFCPTRILGLSRSNEVLYRVRSVC